jgi:hydrogenase maturation factor
LVEESRLIEPGRARPGDRLLLTRAIAVEGTALLAWELKHRLSAALGESMLASARELLTTPGISVVADARVLADSGAITALHDPTEGGVATGVREIATASGCGAVISREAVPVLPETAAIASTLGLDPLGMLASGSLLAAVRAEALEAAEGACRDAGMPFAWIGKLTAPEAGFILRRGTDSGPLPVFNTDEIARALNPEATGLET